MSAEEASLFGDLAAQDAPGRDPGPARYVEASRDEIVFDRFEFDRLIGEEHPARAVWEYVSGVDLTALYERIGARAHTPGRPPPDPRVVLALWLYACVEAVGSARELERLTLEHHGFRWLRGGVPLNYHLLSDFRWQAAEVADRLLTQSVTALWSEGLVSLASLTHDGVRIRASAGASSFRRLETLERLLAAVEDRIARLKQETDGDAEASKRRMRAARERAARERRERVVAALEAARALAGRQVARAAPEPTPDAAAEAGDPPPPEPTLTARADKAGTPKPGPADTTAAGPKTRQPRASTTDVEAHVMRMPDGGWRPAYNVQLTGTLESGLIVGVGVDTTGSDGGLMGPAVADVERRFGCLPQRLLADGGYAALHDIATVAGKGVTVFVPLKPRRNPGSDPAAPRWGDPPAVADWRRRMVADAGAGSAGWMRRRGEHERLNANFRRQGLQQFNVRGSFKVRVVSLLHALANNLMAAGRLRAAAA